MWQPQPNAGADERDPETKTIVPSPAAEEEIEKKAVRKGLFQPVQPCRESSTHGDDDDASFASRVRRMEHLKREIGIANEEPPVTLDRDLVIVRDPLPPLCHNTAVQKTAKGQFTVAGIRKKKRKPVVDTTGIKVLATPEEVDAMADEDGIGQALTVTPDGKMIVYLDSSDDDLSSLPPMGSPAGMDVTGNVKKNGVAKDVAGVKRQATVPHPKYCRCTLEEAKALDERDSIYSCTRKLFKQANKETTTVAELIAQIQSQSGVNLSREMKQNIHRYLQQLALRWKFKPGSSSSPIILLSDQRPSTPDLNGG